MASDIGPTLPKYIVNMMMIFPKMFSVPVRFLESPTVAVALTVSYIALITEVLHVASNRIVDATQIVKKKTVTATAFFIESSEMRLPNRVALFLFLIVENAEQNKVATVTVLIPPAVPTGEPPISIKIMDVRAEAFVRFSCGTEAKPAVLVVID